MMARPPTRDHEPDLILVQSIVLDRASARRAGWQLHYAPQAHLVHDWGGSLRFATAGPGNRRLGERVPAEWAIIRGLLGGRL